MTWTNIWFDDVTSSRLWNYPIILSKGESLSGMMKWVRVASAERALDIFIHPDRRWLAAWWIPMAGVLHGSLQDVEVDRCETVFNAEDSLLSALLHRSIDRQLSGILGKETCVTAVSLINLSRAKKGSLSFQSQSKAAGGGRMAVFG